MECVWHSLGQTIVRDPAGVEGEPEVDPSRGGGVAADPAALVLDTCEGSVLGCLQGRVWLCCDVPQRLRGHGSLSQDGREAASESAVPPAWSRAAERWPGTCRETFTGHKRCMLSRRRLCLLFRAQR